MNYFEENGDEVIFEKDSLWEESVLSVPRLKSDMIKVFKSMDHITIVPFNDKDPGPSEERLAKSNKWTMFDIAFHQYREMLRHGHTEILNILVGVYAQNAKSWRLHPMTILQNPITKGYFMIDKYAPCFEPGVYQTELKNPYHLFMMVAVSMVDMKANPDESYVMNAWSYRRLEEDCEYGHELVKGIINQRPILKCTMSDSHRPNIKFPKNIITGKTAYVEEVEEEFTEAAKSKDDEDSGGNKIPNTKVLYDVSYAKVAKVLSTPSGSAKYQRIIESFLSNNFTKLTTSGPVHKLVFGTNDQKRIFDLFETTPQEINAVLEPFLMGVNKKTNWKLLTNNPVYLLIASACFYYYKAKKKKELDAAIIEMALAIYWSIFVKYWPYGVKESIMNATVENLSGKFLLKQSKNLLDCLQRSGQSGFDFYAEKFDKAGGVLTDFIICNYIQRVHHDQNSMIKNIKSEYQKTSENAQYILTRNDKYDENTPILDENVNATTTVDIMVAKIAPQIINNPVNSQWCKLAAGTSQVSQSDTYSYITKIITPDRSTEIRTFVECILHSFLYTDHYEVRKLKSKEFLAWSRSFVKKTNSKNEVIRRFCAILKKWSEELGIFDRFPREGTQINYKKAIYFYFIFSIMNYA